MRRSIIIVFICTFILIMSQIAS
ncbi:MAG: hypothetical protein QG588_2220, partial [Candidatus Poribacteria bacterium]|nr:hypothetical protein [Candidatus Poribacteria bacterium]